MLWVRLRLVRLSTPAHVFRLTARSLRPRPIVRRVALISLPRFHMILMDEKREARPVGTGLTRYENEWPLPFRRGAQ